MRERKSKVKTNGYYAIYYPSHPNSFGKGYVYEHRYLIEKKIGRLLSKTEIVHHKDGNKLNNNIDNLLLCESIAEHKLEHRGISNLRKPHEENLLIKCACGCGKMFYKYDNSGRLRKYYNGGHCKKHKAKLKAEKRNEEKIFCSCGCGIQINKYDGYGRERLFISGHNSSKIPNRNLLSDETKLSFATIVNYFKGQKLREKTIKLIEQSIIKNYGKNYLRN